MLGKMRRQDRQVTDWARVEAVLAECDTCRLGLADGDEVYVVPLSYGWTEEEGRLTLWFHCAGAGRKLGLIGAGANAGFAIDTGARFYGDAEACTWSTSFRSLIGTGHVAPVADLDEKRRGLLALMAHCTGRTGWTIPDAALESVTVLRLDVTEWTCKEHE